MSRYNNDLEASYHPRSDGIGVDLGVKSLAIVSDGRIFENINTSSRARRLEKRLRREQRRLSRKYEMRKKKGGSTATASANIEKKKLSVQRLHRRLGISAAITRIRSSTHWSSKNHASSRWKTSM